jgi:hypothetical protein
MGQTPSQRALSKPDPRVVAAIDALSLKDIQLLQNYARSKMRRRPFDWNDLLQEAFKRTLCGDRPWSPDDKDRFDRPISLTGHIIGCMRSIANGWCKKESRYSPLSDDHAAPGNLEAEKIAEMDAQADIERLRQALKDNDDFVALKLLEAIGEDKENSLPDYYWTARKRIQRCAYRLFSSSQDKQR